MEKGISKTNDKDFNENFKNLVEKIEEVKIKNESFKNKWINISKLFEKTGEYVIVVDSYIKTSDIGGLPDFFCSTNLETIKKEICNILLENSHFIKQIQIDNMFCSNYDNILVSFWNEDDDDDDIYYIIYLYNIKEEDKINLQNDLKNYIDTNIKKI